MNFMTISLSHCAFMLNEEIISSKIDHYGSTEPLYETSWRHWNTLLKTSVLNLGSVLLGLVPY